MQRYYYLCKSWKGFLQQIVSQLAFGYEYYHITVYSEEKQDKWLQIDKKLINKYQTKKSKFQRSRIKSKGFANFYFLRWENIAVILHSEGNLSNGIVYDDKFKNLSKNPMFLKISERITFKIQKSNIKNKKIDVFLAKESYQNIKEQIYEIAMKTKRKENIVTEFKKLNGLPSYRGINQQQKNLREALIKFCKRHQIIIRKYELFIRTKQDIIAVLDK